MAAFKVTVRGTYIARSAVSNNEKILKNYEIEAVVEKTDTALSDIKNFLLDGLLKAKYGDYHTYLTHVIHKVEPIGEVNPRVMMNLPVKLMSRELLEGYIAMKELPVDATMFPEIGELRDMILLAQDSISGFKKLMEKRRPSIETKMNLARLNPAAFKEGEEVDSSMLMRSVRSSKSEEESKKAKEELNVRVEKNTIKRLAAMSDDIHAEMAYNKKNKQKKVEADSLDDI